MQTKHTLKNTDASAVKVTRKNKKNNSCRYFLRCTNDAVTTIPNPIIGEVMACQKCADFYNKIMPDTPLILYILGGENAVPPRDHGPIINSYKAWQADPGNQANLRN